MGEAEYKEVEVVRGGYGFAFSYPITWSVDSDGDSYAVVKPEEGARDNFNIMMKALPRVPSIEDHAEESIKNLRSSVQGISLSERHFTNIGGKEAFELEFSFMDSGVAVKGKQTFTLSGNAAITITYMATEQGYPKHLGAISEIVKSIRIIP